MSKTLLRTAAVGLWAVAAPALLLCTGCDSGGATPTVSAVRHPTLEDFPIPTGFALDDKQSRSYSPGAVRVVQYTFTGGGERSAVARFFKERLPAEGWSWRSEQFLSGEYYLRFESDKEECTIHVRRTGMKTVINVDIGPLPAGSPERARPDAPKRKSKAVAPPE